MKKLIIIGIITFSLIYSDINAQWQQSNGTIGSYVYCLAANGTGIFAGLNTGYNSAGVILSTDFGNSWTNASSGLPSREIDALAAFGNNLFAAESDAGVYLSTDNGASWAVTGIGVAYVNGFASIESKVFATDAYNGVSYTTDNGVTWIIINNGLTTTLTRAIFAHGSDLFVGTYAAGVFLSTDEGANWTGINNGLPAGYRYVYSFAAIGSNIFCGTYNKGVYITTDNGAHWLSASNGLPSYTVYSFAVSGTNLFAASHGDGVYLSTDNGSNWTSVNSGLTDLSVYSLIINGGYLFAGCDTGGVWRRPLSEMITGVEDTENSLPTNFVLSQNYPNPFNPTTSIEFSLPVAADVELIIYNILGQQVATLINDQRSAGNHSVLWNINDSNGMKLSSGIYFYMLKASGVDGNEFQEIKKMVLLK